MLPKYSILFLDIAREEINDAKEYFDDIDHNMANKFISDVDEMLHRLQENPYLISKDP